MGGHYAFVSSLKVFVPMTIIGMVVLVTVNVGAGFLDDNATTQSTTSTNTNGTASSSNTTQLVFSGIDKLSISNIPDGSPRFAFFQSRDISHHSWMNRDSISSKLHSSFRKLYYGICNYSFFWTTIGSLHNSCQLVGLNIMMHSCRLCCQPKFVSIV